MRIGIFDSGIGGLTVLKEIIKKFPNNHYIYFGDSKNMPYGNKSFEELMNLAKNNIQFLLSKKVDLIIIACGTVSSNINSEFKKQYNIPIIDIINPTINYLNKTNLKNVGIIATTMTINSNVFNKNNLKIKNLILKDCPSFVPIIEKNLINTKYCDLEIEKYLSFMKNQIKNLVLGCTHYPLLEDKLKTFFNNKTNLINIGTIIANELNLKNETNFKLDLYFSDLNSSLKTNVINIMGNNITLKIK